MIESNRVLLKGNKFGPDEQREDAFDSEKHVKDLKSFGWEVLEDEVYKRTNNAWKKYCIMVRQREIAHHGELVELEKEYEQARKSIKPLPKSNRVLAFFLFLILIIPGVIYVNVKKSQRKKTKNANKDAESRMREIAKKAESIRSR